MEGESCCLLCLELKQEFIDAILINSVQCNTLSVKFIIEKHLWTMKHINPSSWLCANCWKELLDFHNFYMRIEKAHENFGILAKELNENAIDFAEAPIKIFLDCPAEQINECDDLMKNDHKYKVESHIIEFKETLNGAYEDCPFGEVNKDLQKDQHNPLLDIEVTSPIDASTLEQKRNLARSRKVKLHGKTSTNVALSKSHKRKRQRKVPHDMDQIKDSTNKSKRSRQVKTETNPEKKIKSKTVESAGHVENLKLQQEPIELLSHANNNDSKNGSDPESLLSVQIKSNVKINTRTKTMRSEQDKFLAENFKITCFLCNTPFETFCNMLKHFEEQHKEPGYVLCCDKKFYRRNVLIDHVNYHLNPNYFKCNQCNKVLEDRRRLELHCKSHEINNGKNFCCNICGKGFIKIAMLNSHKKIHLSEEEKRFSCSQCGKNFASNYMLTNHCRATHLKKYHKICEICGKSIQDKTIFERHMLQHEGKNSPSVSCDICGLLLTDIKALERHKKVIHPEDGQKTYTCPICSKTSPNLRTHKLHVRFTHESGYNYKCTICDKAFKRPQSLKEHMAAHTGEILYNCPWCPKTFNSNANMHSHRKKIHPKEWEENSRKRYSGKLPPRFKPPTKIENTDSTTPLLI